MSDTTTFESQANILGDFWIDYKNSEKFSDFIQYNDIGLPLAYAVSSGILNPDTIGNIAKGFIEETFALLLEIFETEDTGFETLDEIILSP